MKVKVTRAFIDKNTGKFMGVTDPETPYDKVPEYDDERANDLIKKGFVIKWPKPEVKEEKPEETEQPKAAKKKAAKKKK